MEIDSYRNKELLVETVQVWATDELDNGTSRESRSASVQNGIVPTDCIDIHVPPGVLCLSFAQEGSFLHHLAIVKLTFKL